MFGIAIDKDGYKIKFDLLSVLESDIELSDSTIIEQDWDIANSMNKPKWDIDKWVDMDPLPEQIPLPMQPTMEDKVEELSTQLYQVDEKCVTTQGLSLTNMEASAELYEMILAQQKLIDQLMAQMNK